jgi:hypothetical protein
MHHAFAAAPPRSRHGCCSRIVQLSNYLNGGYGADFKYREAMASSSLPAAGLMAAGMAGVGAMFALSPLRNLAKK